MFQPTTRPTRRSRFDAARRLVLAATSALALSGAALTVGVTPAAADTSAPPVAGGVYHIELHSTSDANSLVVDVPHRSAEPEVQMNLWQFNDQDNQRFELRDAGNGYYQIVSRESYYRHSGLPYGSYSTGARELLCLDVAGASLEPWAAVIQYPCGGGDNQRWRPVPRPGGGYAFVAKHSNGYLNFLQTSGAGAVAGNLLVQDPHPVAWRLIRTDIRFNTAAFQVKSQVPYQIHMVPCYAGWHYAGMWGGGVFYNNTGDARFSNEPWHARITVTRTSDGGLIVTWYWNADGRLDPPVITGRITLICFPSAT